MKSSPMREEPPTARVDVLSTNFTQPMMMIQYPSICPQQLHQIPTILSSGLGPYLHDGTIGTFPNHHLLAFVCPQAVPVVVDTLVEA